MVATGPLRKLSVLMPVYNERWTLREIVTRVLDARVPLELELIVVDDCSSDGSWELLQDLAQCDSRIRVVRHDRNRGKGAAVRTAVSHMSGDVAVVQDADLEYNPEEYPRLLEPILDGRADAVFGSRFAGHPRRVLLFWHSVANRFLTLVCNMLNDLTLSDMETCYKMVRADVLRQLRLTSSSFTIEPELTSRLAQWGARIYEVPVSYSGRTFQEGKKIRPIDGLKALWEMIRCRIIDTQFTHHAGFYTLMAAGKADRYNRWVLSHVRDYLGQRVLEAGAGIGNLSKQLLDRPRLVLADYDPLYISRLKERFGRRDNIRIDQADLTLAPQFDRWRSEELDTVFCSNVLEHLEPDEEVLRGFERVLAPGGHCIIIVPAGPRLYTPIDAALGHFRRYSTEELQRKMTKAGFDVVYRKRFSRLGTLGWFVSGRLLRRSHLSPRQMIWFDRLLPLAKLLEHVLPVPGMSLIVVGRKPQKQSVRMAA